MSPPLLFNSVDMAPVLNTESHQQFCDPEKLIVVKRFRRFLHDLADL